MVAAATSNPIATLARLPAEERARVLSKLSPGEVTDLEHHWPWWARPEQLAPPGDWRTWLVCGGRGLGKTRTGAEWVRACAAEGAVHITCAGATAADVRDVMVEGESGILAVSHPRFRPVYEPSKRRLTWPNGTRALLLSADEPDRFRGPQSHYAWADELAAWRFPDAWDQLQFGMRLGTRPRCVVTTTPRPTPLIKALIADPMTVTTTGSTYDNAANLPPAFLDAIRRRYEGTRIGRQEIWGGVLDDNPGALWTIGGIDADRLREHPPSLRRIVVAIDPAVSSHEGSDEVGIVVAGVADVVDYHDPERRKALHGYVLEDASGKYSPDAWARKAVALFDSWKADLIVAEVNQGGAMVEHTLRTVRDTIPYKAIHASRGKRLRAEPVAALYEQRRVHHIGTLARLEDQMCLAAGTIVRTLRGNVSIESVRAGDDVLTRYGWRPVLWSGQTGIQKTIEVIIEGGVAIRGTRAHPIWVEGKGFIRLAEVQTGDKVLSCLARHATLGSSLGASGTTATSETATSSQADREAADCFTATYGLRPTGRSQTGGTSTTSTRTEVTTNSATFSPSVLEIIDSSMVRPAVMRSRLASGARGDVPNGRSASPVRSPAATAVACSSRPGSARATAVAVAEIRRDDSRLPERVYNLTVDGSPEFFANGVLVHNCNWDPMTSAGSPDRVDAAVYALTELMLDAEPHVKIHAMPKVQTPAFRMGGGRGF